MEKEGRYVGEVLERKRINELKCYFVQSDNPRFRYSDNIKERVEELSSRGKLIHERLKNVKGFALVWKPDVIVGTPKLVKGRLSGFGLKDYDFEISMDAGVEREVHLDLDVPITELCPISAEIIGAESTLFRNSQSWKNYYREWFWQNRFAQKYNFKM